jgi:hypothetical protein
MTDGQLAALERELAQAKKVYPNGRPSNPARVKLLEDAIAAHKKATASEDRKAAKAEKAELETTAAPRVAETTDGPRVRRR